MRDKNRIPLILKRLEELWNKHPDMRLAQLLWNIYPCTDYTRIDPYYMEDEEFMSNIEKYYASNPTYRVGGEKDLEKLLKDIRKV